MKRFDTFRHAALGVLCSLTMVVSGLAPMAVQAATVKTTSITLAGTVKNSNEDWTETCGSGTASWDYSENTLTLDGATITPGNDVEGIVANGDIIIKLVGSNSITVTDSNASTSENGIRANAGIAIIGDGSLDITMNGGRAGISAGGSEAVVIGESNQESSPSVSIHATGTYGIYGKSVYVYSADKLLITGDDTGTAEDAHYPTYGIWAQTGNVNFRYAKDVDITGYSHGIYVSGSWSNYVSVFNSNVKVASVPASNTDSIWKDGIYFTGGGQNNTTKICVYSGADLEVYGGIGCATQWFSGAWIYGKTDDVIRGWYETNKNSFTSAENATEYTKETGNNFAYPWNTTCYGMTSNLAGYYVHFKSQSAGESNWRGESDGEGWSSGHHCNHVYEWEVYQQATATNDGIMRYRCKYCGDVQYEVPVTAYYMFNKNTQEAILKAEQGATVTTETALFISFHDMVQEALEQRPDVTLVVDYRNAGKNYEMTIPAGSAEQLDSLFGESQFAGFLYLGGTYATTELPEDWTFSTVPASVVWFGATNAH